MKKLALVVAFVIGFYGLAPAADTETVTVAKGTSTVTIGGVTVPLAAVVAGAIIAGVVVIAVTQNDEGTTIVTRAATTTL